MFESDIMGRSEEQMDVLGHDDERVQLELAIAAIAIQSLQEESDVIFDDEESAPLPGRESYEVRSGRRKESARSQKQTSAAGSRDLCLA